MASKGKRGSEDEFADLLSGGDNLGDLLGGMNAADVIGASQDVADLLDTLVGESEPQHEIKNPLEALPETGTFELDGENEVNAVLEAFMARRKGEEQRIQDQLTPEFWVCIYFWSRRDLDEFLRLSNIGPPKSKYLDGYEVATRLGIDVRVHAE